MVVCRGPSRLAHLRHQSSFQAQTIHQSQPLLRPRFHTSISASNARGIQTSSQAFSGAKFNYYISAAFCAKGQPYKYDKDYFSFDPSKPIVRVREQKSTRPKSGQDSFFVATIGDGDSLAFGIADGVGGWADSGVDPADFAHGLCDFMAWAAYKWKTSSRDGKSLPGAQELLQIGYDEVLNDGKIPAGGSTACVGILKSHGELEIANLGDSGFLHLRLGAVHKQTEVQTHAFNTPYQLSVIPEAIRARTAAFGGTQLQDFPKDADVISHEVRHGDVLVLCTDGVLDNLSSSEILQIVTKSMSEWKAWQMKDNGIEVKGRLQDLTIAQTGQKQLQTHLASEITKAAWVASRNSRRDGPFAKEVQRLYPQENWRGGKVDDICVVVAIAANADSNGTSKL